MGRPYLTDHQTALAEADVDDGVPEAVDVWKRTTPAGRYEVDPDRSRTEFVVRKFKIYPIEGEFEQVSGHIDIDERIERSTMELAVDAASIDTGFAPRDAHLRSSQYLAAKKHPELTFVGEHVQPLGNDTFAVHGELTIKDVIEPAVFHVTMTDRYREGDDTLLTFVATADIDRRAFDVPSLEAIAMWGLMVDPTVTVQMRITAVATG